MLPQRTNANVTILCLLMVVILQAVYAVQQESKHQFQALCSNKFVRIEQNGTVHAIKADYPQIITMMSDIQNIQDMQEGRLPIKFFVKEFNLFLCFNKHWKLVGVNEDRMKRHYHCQFYEEFNRGYFQFQSTDDSSRYISFSKAGKPYRLNGKKPKTICSEFIKINEPDLLIRPPQSVDDQSADRDDDDDDESSPEVRHSPSTKSQSNGSRGAQRVQPHRETEEFNDITHLRHQNLHNRHNHQPLPPSTPQKNVRKGKKKPGKGAQRSTIQSTSPKQQKSVVVPVKQRQLKRRPLNNQQAEQHPRQRHQKHHLGLEEQKQRATQDEIVKQVERAEQRIADFMDEYSNDDNNLISDVDYIANLKMNELQHFGKGQPNKYLKMNKVLDWNKDILENRVISVKPKNMKKERESKPNHRHHPNLQRRPST